jgi:hypothetical protein
VNEQQPRERLARYIRERRQELRLSETEATKRAGFGSRNTWAGAEGGSRDLRSQNYAGIERALEWSAGSVERILAGGEPGIHHVRTAHDDAGATDSVHVTVHPGTASARASVPQPTVVVREDFDLDLQIRKVRALAHTDVRTKQALIEALIDLARDMEIDRARQADEGLDAIVHKDGRVEVYQAKTPTQTPPEQPR